MEEFETMSDDHLEHSNIAEHRVELKKEKKETWIVPNIEQVQKLEYLKIVNWENAGYEGCWACWDGIGGLNYVCLETDSSIRLCVDY